MNIEITPVPPPPSIEAEIKVNGYSIGKIVETGNPAFKYHVKLESKLIHGSLYQGFGNSYDEAMRDAITRNREKRIEEALEIDLLENLIWGE